MTHVVRAVLVLLIVPLLWVPATSVSGVAAARPAPTVSVGSPMPGERFTVTARIGPKVVRPVRLQRLTKKGWVSVVRARTDRRGTARIAWRTRAPLTRLRVLAPRARVKAKQYAARTSRVHVLRQRKQKVGISTRRNAAGRLVVSVRTSHARPGRFATLQVRRGGSPWARLASARMPRGTVRTFSGFSPTAVPAGTRLRAVLSGHRGALSARSPVVTAPPTAPPPTPTTPSPTTPSPTTPSPTTPSPTTPSPTTPSPTTSAPTTPSPSGPSSVRVVAQRQGELTVLTAETSGTVDRVRFFVDGVRVGSDTTSAPHAVTTRLSAGRHEVAARAFGAGQSLLSPTEVLTGSSLAVGDAGMADGLSLEVVQSGFELPTSAAVADPLRVFVSEKSGVVKTMTRDETGAWSQPREVLDLSPIVLDESDAGLIGIAADPHFGDNGHVYLSYVLEDPSDTGERQVQQVARYTWDGDRLDPDSRHVVLGRVTGPACHAAANLETPDCLPLMGRAHTVGDLAFDDTGNLLVGVGDGALYRTNSGLADRYETMRAQNPEVLAGKLLRVDPATGKGVPGNPLFTDDGSANSARVVAMGLRNPFRFSVEDDQVMIGDVGDASHEEIDRLTLHSGAQEVPNFGWPCMEGEQETGLGDISSSDHPFNACVALRATGAQPPVHTYPHQGGGSVTAGVFLRGDGYPAALRDQFLYGDYAQNHLKSLTLSGEGTVSGVRTLADATAAKGPVKILNGPDGWAWSVSIYDGSIRRLVRSDDSRRDLCRIGQFRQSFHDLDGPGSPFDDERPQDEWSWLYPYAAVRLPVESMRTPTCVPDPELAPTTGSPWLSPGEQDTRAHPGDRFGVKWRSVTQFEGGTYRFTVHGNEWMRVRIDDRPVHDFYTSEFWYPNTEHEVVLTSGQHTVEVEYIHGDQPTAHARLTWSRTGGPPSVRITAPGNGWITDGTIPWEVNVSDPDGDPVSDLISRTRVAADFLHYDGDSFHAHPYREATGAASGNFSVDDVHAPGHGVIRLRARTTDASGAETLSAPTYVCFTDGDVGPCAD